MATTSLVELDERIAIVRDNIRELTEQAAALSGAGDESRIADVSPTRSGGSPNSSGTRVPS
jgi:hypothetical protein